MIDRSAVSESVRFNVKAKELDGILTLPTAEAPYPALVLLHGSDRAGVKHPYYADHAENLVQSGFAILRYDGPGWGGGAPEGPGFETLEYRTEEAIAAIRYLQSRPDIKPDAVGLWGVSQGGWICQMAAATYADDVAFIISVSGPGVTPVEQEVYRVEMESRAAGLGQDEIAKAVLMRRLMADIVLSAPLHKEVNLAESKRLGEGPWQGMAELAYTRKSLGPVNELGEIIAILNSIASERWTKALHLEQVIPVFSSLPPQAWDVVKAQMRAVLDVQPGDYLANVHCPVLAIFGEKDTSLPVAKSVSLYEKYLGEAGNDAVTIMVFPNASHTIRINDEFSPGYFELMLNWLRKVMARQG